MMINRASAPGMRMRLISALAALCCGQAAGAHDFGLTYTSELQAGLSDRARWVNLLQTDLTVRLNDNWHVLAGTVSLCSTDEKPIINDLLTYSNIDGENITLALSRAGIRYSLRNWEIFAGVGNINDAFFVTPVTSFFTNSSCGLVPAVACNFAIANYPDASLGIEGQYTTGPLTANAAVYNGKGYHGFAGRDCVFRFCPASDGIFSIGAVNFQSNDNNYNMGFCLSGLGRGSEDVRDQNLFREAEKTDLGKKIEAAFWAYIEQRLICDMFLVAHLSECPTVRSGCRHSAGAGLYYRSGRHEAGAYSQYAAFTDSYECANELTYKYSITGNISLQPALHYIRNKENQGFAALIRAVISL